MFSIDGRTIVKYLYAAHCFIRNLWLHVVLEGGTKIENKLIININHTYNLF